MGGTSTGGCSACGSNVGVGAGVGADSVAGVVGPVPSTSVGIFGRLSRG